jgi:3-oxoacyl-[acyl-carrier protein] reductase
MSTKPLDKKIALVTGAGRGIGKAIALRLAHDGATVFVHYGSSHVAADDVVDQIEKEGGIAFAVEGDFSSLLGVERLVRGVLAKEKHIDILINNAGVQTRDGIFTITEHDFDHSISVNLKAAVFLAQNMVPHMRDGGRIVNLTSGLSQIAFPQKAVYAMAKAAINSFTKSLAKELGPRGIHVNAVAPGIVGTDMNAWASSGEGRKRVAAMSPLNRITEPEDVAEVVAFLCGPGAACITGAYIDSGSGMSVG